MDKEPLNPSCSHSQQSPVYCTHCAGHESLCREQHYIDAECPRCKKAKAVDRQPWDPSSAAKIVLLCPECVASDFDQITYYDRDGNEVFK